MNYTCRLQVKRLELDESPTGENKKHELDVSPTGENKKLELDVSPPVQIGPMRYFDLVLFSQLGCHVACARARHAHVLIMGHTPCLWWPDCW